jgi:PAS domain S-box-containing protein
MLKVHFNKGVLAGFVIMLGILTWLIFYSYLNTKRLVSSSQWVAHTHDVLYHAESVLAMAVNVEIGQRGFTLSGSEESLSPYHKAKAEIHNALTELKVLIRDNVSQQEKLKKLSDDVDELLLFSGSVVDARRQDFETALKFNSSMQGKIKLDKIRNIILDFEGEEKELLRLREKQNEVDLISFNRGFVTLITISVLLLIGVFFSVNSNLKARNDNQEKLTKASLEIQDLYDNAPCGYHSLDRDGVFVDINNTLMKWMGFASKAEIVGRLKFSEVIADDDLTLFHENYSKFKQNGFINDVDFRIKGKNGSFFPVILSSIAIVDEGGNFIKSRSVTIDNSARKKSEEEIRILNKELEAFTYSVSHDLRAPLRSIDGYARVLQEDFYDKLDDEGKRVIKVIMNNAKRMGQLIDDLLDFARLGRRDVARANVDMTALVKNIVDDLVKEETGRKIDVVVHPLKPSLVDTDMIRQVWINLISNAIKYTSRKDASYIEINSTSSGNEVIYHIKDNGVGFDMQYSGKLFGVFQRLHKMQDFQGTGVGLAIVKRIVSRHEGRVWAEGDIDSGATFYFTIPINGKQ